MVALQEAVFLINQNGDCVISDWVRQQQGVTWKTKLIEALSIIQDYRILQSLG